MTNTDITGQLEAIASVEDFATASAALTDTWLSLGAGIEVVEPILRFMEGHPSIEYGMPGALVHFVERFYEKGYEESLIRSTNRKPTLSTIWMLNRVINGATMPDKRQLLIEILQQAKSHPSAVEPTLQRITAFLHRLSRRDSGEGRGWVEH